MCFRGCSALPWGFPCDSVVKKPSVNAGEAGSIPGSGRYPRRGNGNPLQYSCWKNTMDRGKLVGSSPWGRKELDMTWYACTVQPCATCMLSCFSHVRPYATLWTIACQAPLGILRQEYWSGLLCPPLGDLPEPGIEPVSLVSTCTGRRVLYH